MDELADEDDQLIEEWWDETVSAAVDKARQRKEGFSRYFRAYFREGGTDFPAFLGTYMSKATEPAFLADRTKEMNGSGTAFLEYRDIPFKDLEDKDKDEKK